VLPGRTGAFHHQLSSRPGFAAVVAHVASCTHTIPKLVLCYVFSYLACSDSGLAFFQISYKFSVYCIVSNKLYQTFTLEDHAFRLSASTRLVYSLLSI